MKEIKQLIQLIQLDKESIKYMQFNQFFIDCAHNKNEIKGSPKIRVKT